LFGGALPLPSFEGQRHVLLLMDVVGNNQCASPQRQQKELYWQHHCAETLQTIAIRSPARLTAAARCGMKLASSMSCSFSPMFALDPFSSNWVKQILQCL
jgi:hypothetical protein